LYRCKQAKHYGGKGRKQNEREKHMGRFVSGSRNGMVVEGDDEKGQALNELIENKFGEEE
jgi:hypothetical protein